MYLFHSCLLAQLFCAMCKNDWNLLINLHWKFCIWALMITNNVSVSICQLPTRQFPLHLEKRSYDCESAVRFRFQWNWLHYDQV